MRRSRFASGRAPCSACPTISPSATTSSRASRPTTSPRPVTSASPCRRCATSDSATSWRSSSGCARKLRAEGLFDPARKKPIPFLPHVIGLITGEKSDAEKDVRHNAELRWPQVRFRTAYAAVQGDRCVPETIGALKALDADPGGRRDRHRARRRRRAAPARASATSGCCERWPRHPPPSSARSATRTTTRCWTTSPTSAPRRRPMRRSASSRTSSSSARSSPSCARDSRCGSRSGSSHDIAQLEQLRSRPVLRAPETMIDARSQQLWLLVARGRDDVDRRIEAQARRAAELRAALRTLSPASTLARGYAIAHLTDGVIVRDAAQASAGHARPRHRRPRARSPRAPRARSPRARAPSAPVTATPRNRHPEPI